MKSSLADKKYKEMAERLVSIRRALSYENIREYSENAGIPYKSYHQCENGTHSISVRNAIRLRERYGISLDFIYCGSVDTLPHKIANALSSMPLDNTSSTSKVKGED
jgi:hypothetical protein